MEGANRKVMYVYIQVMYIYVCLEFYFLYEACLSFTKTSQGESIIFIVNSSKFYLINVVPTVKHVSQLDITMLNYLI